jgi:hypothetical protein
MDDIIIVMLVVFVTLTAGMIYWGVRKGGNDDRKYRETIAADIPQIKVAKEKSKAVPKDKMTNRLFVKTEQDYMSVGGSTPFVEFDENWNQMPLNRTVTKIPREHLTRMYPLAYLAGKVSVFAGKKETSLLLIIILFAALASAGVSYMQGNANQKSIETQQGSINSVSGQVGNLTSQVSSDHEVIQAIAIKLNVPLYASSNNTVPTVG